MELTENCYSEGAVSLFFDKAECSTTINDGVGTFCVHYKGKEVFKVIKHQGKPEEDRYYPACAEIYSQLRSQSGGSFSRIILQAEEYFNSCMKESEEYKKYCVKNNYVFSVPEEFVNSSEGKLRNLAVDLFKKTPTVILSNEQMLAMARKNLEMAAPDDVDGNQRIIDEIERRLNTPEYKNNPSEYMKQWEKDRGITEEYRIPEDPARKVMLDLIQVTRQIAPLFG